MINPQEEIIINLSQAPEITQEHLESLKRETAKKYRLAMPTNAQLLAAYHKLVQGKRIKENKEIENVLRIRKIRSLSGIVVVSVLTKPYPCPGQCIFCPERKGLPKSYLEGEPAVMRAIANKFNPYRQIQARIEALEKTGHPVDKIDLRIIGGTWSYYPKNYQTWFIKECFRGANEYKSKSKTKNKKQKARKQSLESLQKQNEKAKCRIIGITIETRPDYIDTKEIKRLRKLGITRVELGVQSIYDNVLELNKRGHGVKETIRATQLLKDAGFKICYQMMPNLPGSDFKRDVEMFRELFSNENFQPDLLKIYPLALIKETPLFRMRKRLHYKPYTKEELIRLLIKIKKQIPYYCRIQRIIRDFPSSAVVEGGAKVSNLRQIVAERMAKQGLRCKCIRCREVKGSYNPQEKIYLFREDYKASGGKEIFLSFENKERTRLYSLLRLRIPGQAIFPALKGAAIVRELHTYGQLVPVNKKGKAPQHKGLGKKLMKEAEKITQKEFGLKKVAVISGIGVRDYYRKLAYRLKDSYMIKQLK